MDWFSRPSLQETGVVLLIVNMGPVFTPKNNLYISLVVSIDTWTSAIICNLEMLVHVFIKSTPSPLMYPSLLYRPKMEFNFLCLTRHEEQYHGETLPADSTSQEEIQEDYKFNYHSAKLTFGLVLFEFNDAVKEGDGGRLFELYKLALLLYKTHGLYKYAYAVLLYLVKYIAILPPSQALRLKWNRTFNGSGLPGRIIPLDLQKEHDNKDNACGTIWVQILMNIMPKELLVQGNLFTSLLTETAI